MDIRMPAMDGLEATRQLLGHRPTATRVLILTTFDADEYVYEALHAGASGFVLKDIPPEQLVDAIRTIAHGEQLVAPAITRRLIEAYVRTPPVTPGRCPARSTPSRRASGRCCCSSPAGCPTPRSPPRRW